MNREPSSELVSAVAPVKTESESSAATPATPNTMPGAALHSVVFSLEYPRKKVKGEKKLCASVHFPSLFSLPLSALPLFVCQCDSVCFVFSSLSLCALSGVYIYIHIHNLVSVSEVDDRSALGKDLFHGRF